MADDWDFFPLELRLAVEHLTDDYEGSVFSKYLLFIKDVIFCWWLFMIITYLLHFTFNLFTYSFINKALLPTYPPILYLL